MKTDREKYGFRGRVKSVLAKRMTFEERVDQTIEKPFFTYTMAFNENGWLTEQTGSNVNGLAMRTVHDYSDSDKLLVTRRYEASGALFDEMKYIYDDEERLVAEQHVSQDGTVSTPITYTYDTAGLKVKIQELDYNEHANLIIGIEDSISWINADNAHRIETRYDNRDKVVEVKVFDTAGSLVTRVEIVRDPRGKPLEETQYQGDVVRFGPGSCSTAELESLTEEDKAEFTAVAAQMFAPGKVLAKHINKYDVEGRLIESELTMMGMVFGRQTFAYDEAGNRSEEIMHNVDGTVGKSIYTRDYDEHGNWTKELVSTVSNWDAEFGLSTPAQVTHRTISYYT